MSGFRREVDESCTLLGYYAASSDNFLPTFRDSLSVSTSEEYNSFVFLTHEDAADRLSRNVLRSYHNSLRKNPDECNCHRKVMLKWMLSVTMWPGCNRLRMETCGCVL